MSDIENDISEENEEPENTCVACGEDHEIHECDLGFCGHCHEILDNCDCEEPNEITAEEWLKGYRADMEALKAESEALRQAHAEQELAYDHEEMLRERDAHLNAHEAGSATLIPRDDCPECKAASAPTVDVQVELLAFPYEVKERTVRVPKEEWDAADFVTSSLYRRLDLVFHYGQNDFQPSRTCYSVSMNDVIRMPDGKRYRVAGMGFEEIPKQEANVPRPDACSKCGGEKDGEGWCAKYCMDDTEERAWGHEHLTGWKK